jgi:DNA-binding NarL/FixJ family response regulator
MEQTIRKSPNAVNGAPARVLIVDDHPAVREGLVSRISRQSDLIVCGEAANVIEALRLVSYRIEESELI